MSLLNIKRPQREGKKKRYMKGFNLEVNPGEVHAIMGPNGSGRHLASVLAGREDYEVTGGTVDFSGKDQLDMDPEERAREGLFLAFQYRLVGVSNVNFMRAALNEMRNTGVKSRWRRRSFWPISVR